MWNSATALSGHAEPGKHNGMREHNSYKRSSINAHTHTHTHNALNDRQSVMGFRGLWRRQMGQSAVIEVICGVIQRHWCSTVGYTSKWEQRSIIRAVALEPTLDESPRISTELQIVFSFISRCIVSLCCCSTQDISANVFGYHWICLQLLPSKMPLIPRDVFELRILCC